MEQIRHRQGDLLFTKVDGIPSDVRTKPRKNGIIAEGEVTGHMHEIVDWSPSGGVAVLDNVEDDGEMFVTAKKNTVVTHPEHADIALEEGTWHVQRQREYTPEEIRRVVD